MTVYLVNPPKGGRAGRKPTQRKRRAPTMATPKRNAAGRFMKGGAARAAPARKRRAPRRAAASRAAAPRRKTYRRNPPRSGIIKNLTEGVGDAFAVIGGEVAVGYIPNALNLPTTGTTGMVTQGLTAVGVGMLADLVLPRRFAKPALAGALAVPIRAALINAGIPMLSDALQPSAGLGRYVQPMTFPMLSLPSGGGSRALRANRGTRGGLGRYVSADRRLYS